MVDIERTLVALADVIDWPEADIGMAVRERIAGTTRGRNQLPRWVLATGALLILVSVLIATPAGRRAVATILEVAGISVSWGEPLGLVGPEFELGDVVTLGEAADAVAFDLLEPADPPATIYLDEIPSGGAVHMVWRAGGPLPSVEGTGVGTIYTQFLVTESELFVKRVDGATDVERVEVRGHAGFWIEGTPHNIVYRDATGEMREEFARMAGNVLAWEEAGVTHRIETIGSLEATLQLAESLQPLDP
jgi:hypothetical protein